MVRRFFLLYIFFALLYASLLPFSGKLITDTDRKKPLMNPVCIYAHILDEDRKVNAQKFETAFYAKPDLRNVRPPEEPAKSEPATLDLESLVEQLQKSPELASALAALIAAQAPAK